MARLYIDIRCREVARHFSTIALFLHEPPNLGGILRRHTNDVSASRQVGRLDFHHLGAVLLAEDHGTGDVEDLDMVDGFGSLNAQLVADRVGIEDDVDLGIFVHAFNELEVGD